MSDNINMYGYFLMDALELKNIVSDGLLSFPVTDFDQSGDFNKSSYAKRLEWLANRICHQQTLLLSPDE